MLVVPLASGGAMSGDTSVGQKEGNWGVLGSQPPNSRGRHLHFVWDTLSPFLFPGLILGRKHLQFIMWDSSPVPGLDGDYHGR